MNILLNVETKGESMSTTKKEAATETKKPAAATKKAALKKPRATKPTVAKANNLSLESKIKLIDDRAKIPSRAHESDTGYDLKMIDVEKIQGDTIFFKTGISVEPPSGFYFEVYPRSSISKLPLSLSNSVGIIDSDYRGEIPNPG